MNEDTRRDDEPAPDIAALFAAQADAHPAPPALDARLLAAARSAAGAAPTATTTATTTVADAASARRVSRSRPFSPPRWLAAAAVLVLAVALVPLLTREAPDVRPSASADRSVAPSTIERTSAEPPAPAASAGSDIALESDASSPVELAPPSAPPASDALRRDAAASAPFASPATSTPPARTFAAPKGSASTAGTDADAAGRSGENRSARERDPRDWLADLRRRLRAEGLTRELRDEYRRFRARHPDIAPAFDAENEDTW